MARQRNGLLLFWVEAACAALFTDAAMQDEPPHGLEPKKPPLEHDVLGDYQDARIEHRPHLMGAPSH